MYIEIRSEIMNLDIEVLFSSITKKCISTKPCYYLHKLVQSISVLLNKKQLSI
jgi:hypothetical protein